MIFWDIGGAVFAARWVFRDPNMDLRMLIAGALLPNLLDKPIGLVLFQSHFESGRLYAHSLLFAATALFAVMLFTSRGSAARKRLIALPIGVLLHLVLDLPLENEVLWWPFLGFDLPTGDPATLGAIGDYLIDNPLVVAQEILGLVYLTVLARRVGWSERTIRSEFWRSGRLPA